MKNKKDLSFIQKISLKKNQLISWLKKDSHIKLLLLLFIVFEIYFSVTYLSNQSLRLDESQSLYVSGKGAIRILNIIAQDVHVPLYLILLRTWQSIFNLTPLDVVYNRIFSLIFQLIAIPSFYVLSKRVFKKKESAIFGAALVTISPILLWYANELRMYSLLLLMTILSHITFFDLKENSNKFSYWLKYTIVGLIGIYTHYFFNIILFSQFLYALLYKKDFKITGIVRLIQTYIILGIAYVPWIFMVITQGSASNTKPLLAPPNSIDVFNTLTHIFFGFQNDTINTAVVSAWPIITIIGILLINFKKPMDKISRYYMITGLLPILLAFIVSVIYRPVFLSRYLIIVVPSFYILLTSFSYSLKNSLGYIFRVLVILFMATGLLFQTFNPLTPVKENYREVTNYVNQNATENDIVTISAPFTIYPIQYYYESDAKVVTIPEWELETEGTIPEFDQEIFEQRVAEYEVTYDFIYVILSYDQSYEKDIKDYFDSKYKQVESKEFSNKLNLFKYQFKY